LHHGNCTPGYHENCGWPWFTKKGDFDTVESRLHQGCKYARYQIAILFVRNYFSTIAIIATCFRKMSFFQKPKITDNKASIFGPCQTRRTRVGISLISILFSTYRNRPLSCWIELGMWSNKRNNQYLHWDLFRLFSAGYRSKNFYLDS